MNESIGAEKVIFRDTYFNEDSVTANNGTLTGSPTVQRGVVLDGSTQYVTYAIPNTLLAKPKISFVIEFIPDFDYDHNILINLYCSTTREYRVYKHDNAGGNKLGISVGGTLIEEILSSAYSDYWKVNKRNVLIVSSESGNTNVYLNGECILDSDTTVFSVAYPDSMFVGARENASGKIDGTILSFSIHNRLFTQEDATAIQNNSLFNFFNKADVWLDMKSLSGELLKDKSGKGRDFTNVQGTFSSPGMDLNGTTAYLKNEDASGIYNNSEQSIVMCFRPDFEASDGVYRYLVDSSPGKRYIIAKQDSANLNRPSITLANTFIANIELTDYSDYWKNNSANVLVISSKSGNTDIYLNGHMILEGDSSAWGPVNPALITLGVVYAKTLSFFDGKILHFSTYPLKLSPTRAKYITEYTMREYH